MKAISKLVFVLLLAVICFSRPTRVKAGGSYYYCEAQPLGQCVGSLNVWMTQCAYGCTYGGSQGNRQCYSTAYSGCTGQGPCPWDPSQTCATGCYQSTYQDCYQTNNPSCVSGCVNQFNEQYNNCFAEYCQSE
jgi:hypothetical protein